MGQVTIFIDNELENKIQKAANTSQLSVSKWVANIIKEKISTEWPQDVVNLAGSWKEDFPSLQKIRSGLTVDSSREGL
jgi:hypothetical protein